LYIAKTGRFLYNTHIDILERLYYEF
jgi:hypothetical protein